MWVVLYIGVLPSINFTVIDVMKYDILLFMDLKFKAT